MTFFTQEPVETRKSLPKHGGVKLKQSATTSSSDVTSVKCDPGENVRFAYPSKQSLARTATLVFDLVLTCNCFDDSSEYPCDFCNCYRARQDINAVYGIAFRRLCFKSYYTWVLWVSFLWILFVKLLPEKWHLKARPVKTHLLGNIQRPIVSWLQILIFVKYNVPHSSVCYFWTDSMPFSPNIFTSPSVIGASSKLSSITKTRVFVTNSWTILKNFATVLELVNGSTSNRSVNL